MKKRVRDLKDQGRTFVPAFDGIHYDRKPVERLCEVSQPSGKRTTLGDLLDRALDRMDERLER